jgi:hypothetical protein
VIVSDACRESIQVLDEQFPVCLRGPRELQIELVDKARLTALRDGIEVTEGREGRMFEVILNDLAADDLGKRIPDTRITRQFSGELIRGLFRRSAYCRKVPDVTPMRVNVDDIRLEGQDLPGFEYRIFVILVVFGLVEGGLKPIRQQQHFE